MGWGGGGSGPLDPHVCVGGGCCGVCVGIHVFLLAMGRGGGGLPFTFVEFGFIVICLKSHLKKITGYYTI